MKKFIPTTIDEFLDERIAFCEVGLRSSEPDKWAHALSKLKYCKSLDRKFHSLQFRGIFNEFIEAELAHIKEQLNSDTDPYRAYNLELKEALTLLLQK